MIQIQGTQINKNDTNTRYKNKQKWYKYKMGIQDEKTRCD